MSSFDIFTQIYNEIPRMAEKIDSEDKALSQEDIRNREYTRFIQSFDNYFIDRSKTNIKLRKSFFNCSFALLFILSVSLIGVSIIVCLFVKTNVATLVTIVSTIAGLVPSILLLPRIIGAYLFPKKEEEFIRDLIYKFKESDDNKHKELENKKDNKE